MLFSNSLLLDTLAFLTFSFALAELVLDRRSSRLAILRGPRSNNLFVGRLREVIDDTATAVDRWVSEYGYVFKVPTGLGNNRIVITDPKAVAHVYANDSFVYLRSNFQKTFSRTFHDFLRQRRPSERRAISPAFSNGALRDTMSIFYDSAYKLKGAWDVLFESHDEVTIDVQQWIKLESIGIAGFGHDFRSLDGQKSPISEASDALLEDNSFRVFLLFGVFFPQVFQLPLKQTKMIRRMQKAFFDTANVLLENFPQEKETLDFEKDRSILGLLLKGRSQTTNFKLLQDEVVGQIVRSFQRHIRHVLTIQRFVGPFPVCRQEYDYFFVVGALITGLKDLTLPRSFSRHPEKQDKLRRELLQFSGGDPTWDQVVTGTACPYLDAVVHESFRLHPAVESLDRTAAKDDVVPLSYPMKTSSGKMVDTLFPFGDQMQFVPERWLEENPYPSKDFSGYRHLYTFSDGPRKCLGRMFALAESKAVLSVLVRNFTFELPSGPDTPIGTRKALMPRPKLADEAGFVLRMRVRQVTG
ncbi:hypothetical protein M378DRAFT_9529 [Amanita muscaria Koide BX008]|uniref:Cytochrome P450 n=1 Tax=Amanita muscaria (strain Koide BX008) TaxID=946122 RepID=A0A0C2WZN1_AMAMK|nr:hypothetical protein M378DRAFT_9529 [Amanita muscaria Koide BX008]